MADIIKFEKTLSTLPAILNPNTVYCVRVGLGFDFYISNIDGTIAHKINTPELNVSKSIVKNIPRFSTISQQWILKNEIGSVNDRMFYFGGFPVLVESPINSYTDMTRVEEGIAQSNLSFSDTPFPSTLLPTATVSNINGSNILTNPNSVISSTGFIFEELVTVYDGNTIIGEVTVALNGSWSLNFTFQQGNHDIKYRVKDVLGNLSPFSPSRLFTY